MQASVLDRMKRKKFVPILIILIALLGSACTNTQQEPQNQDTTLPPSNVEPIEPTAPAPPAYTSPLTGMGGDEPFTQRLFMVMVENAPAARPQSGLNKADLVYEVLAEGGITRFAAFYQSEYPENVGPVRSIRPYFLDLGGGFDAILVHAGGSEEAKSIITKKGLPSINGLNGGMEPDYFWRVPFRKKPHNLYTDFTKLKAAAEALKLRKESEIPEFYFHDPDDPVIGEDAAKITITYNPSYTVEYQYDPVKKAYLRSMDGKPHKDLITDEQIAPTNILVIKAKHRVLDREGRLAVDLRSGGSGTLFERGKGIPVKWVNVKGVIRASVNGEEVKFYPGKTWIEIIPEEGASLSYE